MPAIDRVYVVHPSRSVHGFGVLQPFIRDRKIDFAVGGGDRLIKSVVEQVLFTEASSGEIQGELPWNPDFGSKLHLVRHKTNFDVVTSLIETYIADALARWIPSVVMKSLMITKAMKDSNTAGYDIARTRLIYDVVQNQATDNAALLLSNIDQTIDVRFGS